MASVRSWLSELGLDSYWGLLEAAGYITVDSLRYGWWRVIGCCWQTVLVSLNLNYTITFLMMLCRKLNDHELTNIGILDANHRRAILHKASGGGMEDDFSSMLGDLSSVIKDLECFSVVSGGQGVVTRICTCV